MTILRTAGLTRHFAVADGLVRAVDGVDLSIERGEFVSIMGPSGCGKSTLLHLIGGLDRATAGAISFDGRPVHDLSEREWAHLRRGHIGFVFQAYNLVDDLSVRDNVELAAVLAGASPRAARERAREVLENLGVAERAALVPGRLSGGEQQRVAIARALVTAPDLLLADEPTGALDSQATTDVLGILRDLHQRGQTVIVVTHDPRVATTADRLLTMRDGRIVDETRLDGTGSLTYADLLEP